jgi:hypothetical protein
VQCVLRAPDANFKGKDVIWRPRQAEHSFTFLDDLVEDAVGGLAVAGRNASPGAVVQWSRPGTEHGVGRHLQEAAGASRALAARLAAGSARVQTAPHLKSTTPHWPSLTYHDEPNSPTQFQTEPHYYSPKHTIRYGLKAKLGIFLFTADSRPALGPTQPPIQWVPRALSVRVKRPGVKLTTHIHLAPRSGMRGAIPPSPIRLHGVRGTRFKARGQLHLYFITDHKTQLLTESYWRTPYKT